MELSEWGNIHTGRPGVLSVFGLPFSLVVAIPLGERISGQVHRSDRDGEKKDT